MENEGYQNKEQDRRIKELETKNKELRLVVFNHITSNTKAMGDLRIEVVKVKTDVSWLKRNYWIVATASVVTVIAAIANIIIK